MEVLLYSVGVNGQVQDEWHLYAGRYDIDLELNAKFLTCSAIVGAIGLYIIRENRYRWRAGKEAVISLRLFYTQTIVY